MIDFALAYLYIGLPTTIGLLGLAAMKLHERSTPSMPADPVTSTPSATYNYAAPRGWGVIGTFPDEIIRTTVDPGSINQSSAVGTGVEVNASAAKAE